MPSYIVTFSDMVTLLLTFFVMLLSLADVQDPELFNLGRGSFVESIRGFGLGMLRGHRARPVFGEVQTKYFTSSTDELAVIRTTDAKEEKLRRLFKRITRRMTAMPSTIVGEKVNYSVASIRFLGGSATLNRGALVFLRRFCLDLQQDQGPDRGGIVYVLGLAPDAATEKEQWLLSGRRAHAVAEFLRDALSSPMYSPGREDGSVSANWSVCSWGAGPGGDWVSRDSPVSQESQILIGVVKASN